MAQTAEKISELPTAQKNIDKNKETPLSTIQKRRSQELIIGLCGSVGSGIRGLKRTLEKQLQEFGYYVEHIRLSELIISANEKPSELSELTGFQRYKALQDAGDALRKKHRSSILAEMAIREITFSREKEFGGKEDTGGALKNQQKAAYIIDQLKHPEEILLLKEAYRNNFYQLGMLRTENERRANLTEERMSESEAGVLIERDRKAVVSHGQHVEKCLHKSDYFIRNIDNQDDIKSSVTRFIKLVHGTDHITPTKDEVGIYAAYSASLQSACLSRQVGAAIADNEGNILSTGCNDVPKFGGGLYNAESKNDRRCFNHEGRCFNDKHKDLLKLEIEQILKNRNIKDSSEIAKQIIEESKAKSLIEYSRAIHAEMDAITSLARNVNNSTVGKTLYCTTYPCHVCARHIVASGIERVVYIEPYEKSLATQLHSDSIYHPDNRTQEGKVLIENFEGVSPFRYSKFFSFNQKRKDHAGEVIGRFVSGSGHVDYQHLDSYGEYELKIIQMLDEELPEIEAPQD
ncbi:anti-phage dCTP deaminase [Pseudoalteromonas sp. P1-7a]|uniref:anti-phage dCTP deaminase n=1 Tax=Pseudoalteromonas sp. P1-7a TaxID=1723755 RepID=UPI0006D66F2D|nr:anti-phage dCTP deaminase [Pseudoalteromonas sp. P1-7a]KPZ58714.1 tRNA-specific adenosine deaminase [Pseudoalteromonas sp. P1-7a]